MRGCPRPPADMSPTAGWARWAPRRVSSGEAPRCLPGNSFTAASGSARRDPTVRTATRDSRRGKSEKHLPLPTSIDAWEARPTKASTSSRPFISHQPERREAAAGSTGVVILLRPSTQPLPGAAPASAFLVPSALYPRNLAAPTTPLHPLLTLCACLGLCASLGVPLSPSTRPPLVPPALRPPSLAANPPRPEEQDAPTAHEKVDKRPHLVRHVRAVVAADHTVPGGTIGRVKSGLDRPSHVALHRMLGERLPRGKEGVGERHVQ